MKVQSIGKVLTVSEIPELTAVNSAAFRESMAEALRDAPTTVEIDLSKTRFMDSSGLGALFSLYRTAGVGRGTTLRLLNPTSEVQQLLELTQMQQLFEIVKS